MIVASRTLTSAATAGWRTLVPTRAFNSRQLSSTRSFTATHSQFQGSQPLNSLPQKIPTKTAGKHYQTSVIAQAGGNMSKQEVAILGGGCFWCIEACYNQIRGVYSAISGYAGGHVVNPTYEQVCDKQTGHAEVVKVTFDPSVIDYKTILEIFFSLHDPTTKDRQGNDVGPQYRSMIMYTSEEQKKIAEEVMKEVTEQKIWSAPIVTELLPESTFYTAEKYHQRYYEQNPNQGYCSFVVGPKVAKFRQKWLKYLNTSNVA